MTTTKITAQDLTNELSIFTGTEHWYRHPFGKGCTYTDGVKHFAEAAGAYWFLDIVFTELVPLMRAEGFLVITMTVANGQASIVATDGNGDDGEHVKWQRQISYTDCPPGKWQFFFVDDVLLLPSEY